MTSKANQERGAQIRTFMLENVSSHRADLVTYTAEYFGTSRQAIHKHLKQLIQSHRLKSLGEGSTHKQYQWGAVREKLMHYVLDQAINVDAIWENDFAPLIDDLVSPAVKIAVSYALKALVKNAISHAQAHYLYVCLQTNQNDLLLIVRDDGVGIVETLQAHYHLDDPKRCLFELAKGKFSCQPDCYEGNSLAICSRLFEEFAIDSNKYYFTRMPFGKLMPLVNDPQTTIRLLIALDLQFDPACIFHAMQAGHAYIPLYYLNHGSLGEAEVMPVLERLASFSRVTLDFQAVKKVSAGFIQALFNSTETRPFRLDYCNATIGITELINDASYAKIAIPSGIAGTAVALRSKVKDNCNCLDPVKEE